MPSMNSLCSSGISIGPFVVTASAPLSGVTKAGEENWVYCLCLSSRKSLNSLSCVEVKYGMPEEMMVNK